MGLHIMNSMSQYFQTRPTQKYYVNISLRRRTLYTNELSDIELVQVKPGKTDRDAFIVLC